MIPRFSVDETRGIQQLLAPGCLANVGECVISTGGPVSNTGLSLMKLGWKVVFMGKVGDDAFGALVRRKMAERGCEEGIIVDPSAETSYTIILAPPKSDRVFLHNPGANDSYCADDLDYAKLEDVRLFHFGYPPLMSRMMENDGEQLVRIFKGAKERGATTSLDMSLPDPEAPAAKVNWERIFERVLPYVDLFLPSAEEMTLFLNRAEFLRKRAEAARIGKDPLDLFAPEEYSSMSSRILQYGVGAVTLKSGFRGYYIRTADSDRLSRFGRAKVGDIANWAERELWEPIYTVERIASATGSGDSSIAGFLASFLRGESIESALKYATAAGKQNVLVHDAVSGIKSFEETTAEMRTWKKAPMKVECPHWVFDSTNQLWHGPNDQPR
jgi:sugar/nucleoside kinase (ribokinase family)